MSITIEKKPKTKTKTKTNTKTSRDKYQTIKEILLSLPGRQTHITFRAHLGHYQAKYYFKLLQESDLIRNHNSRYFITGKGKHYLYLLEQRGPPL